MKATYFFLAAAALTLAACSSDSVENDGQIRLTTKSMSVQTRADQDIQESQFLSGESVDIFFRDNNDASSTQYPGTAIVYTADGSGNLTTATKYYWPVKMHSLEVYGVYHSGKASAYNATGVSFSVQPDQSNPTEYKNSDLMTGAPTAPSGNPLTQLTTANPITLTFTHLLTKVKVNLSKTEGTTDITDSDLANATIKILNTKPNTTFDVQSTTVTTASGTEAPITAGTGTAVAAIVVPQTISEGTAFIQVEVGSDTFVYSIPSGGLTLDSKTVYTFDIKINKTNIVVTTAITPWTTTTAIEGNAEMQ